MGCTKSIACYPAKIPHFFENLKILAFYAILPSTPLIAGECFVQELPSGFERFVCRLALPSNRWLKRPTPRLRRVPSHLLGGPSSRRRGGILFFKGLEIEKLDGKLFGLPVR